MYKRNDGRYCHKFTIDGKIVYFYSSAETERKAKKDIDNQIAEYRFISHEKKHKLSKLFDRMIGEKEKTVSYKTIETYKTAYNHLGRLRDRYVEEIEPFEIQKLFTDMLTQGYSKSSISKVKIVYGLIISYAMLNGLKVQNSASVVPVPKQAKQNKRRAVSDDDIDVITSSLNVEFDIYAFLLLYTGLRRGEALALVKEDVNLETRTITVNKSIEYDGNNPKVKTQPKTENGIRTIPILDILYDPLRELKKNTKKGEYLFGGKTPLSKTQIFKKWKKLITELGIDITQHQLRHTYAKILYRSGVDAKTAQGLLGHADISTTMNIYTEFSKDVTEKNVAKINSFISEF
jgi:integrase